MPEAATVLHVILAPTAARRVHELSYLVLLRLAVGVGGAGRSGSHHRTISYSPFENLSKTSRELVFSPTNETHTSDLT